MNGSGAVVQEERNWRSRTLIMLPTPLAGRDRYMRAYLFSIVTIFKRVGHLDIFLTITCSPKCEEPLAVLLTAQNAQHKPANYARRLRLKIEGTSAHGEQ